MASQIAKVVGELRDAVIAGALKPGERIIELQFSVKLGVSRTPLRLALAELEREGVLERLPSRGFRVRAFSMDDIADAIEVRGALEAMAARSVAERGPSPGARAILEAAVSDGQALLAPAARDVSAEVDTFAWRAVNERFHAALINAAENHALTAAMAHNNKTPLSGPGAVTLQTNATPLQLGFLLRAQEDHEELINALIQRQGGRAEAIMREHAWRSRANRRASMETIRAAGVAAPSPEVAAAAAASFQLA